MPVSAVFRRLDREEIYFFDMLRQFPDSERRTWSNIAALLEQGGNAGYGLFEQDTLRAYGLTAFVPGENDLLLDYLAVPDIWKGWGYGSMFLNKPRSVLHKNRPNSDQE